MTDDKYIQEKLKPIIDDIKVVWKLDDKDEWLKQFKETIANILNKCYDDGFQDGVDEGDENREPEPPDYSWRD